MKKLVLTLTATLACVAAFAQGKISFANDSLHLVYFDQNMVKGQDNAVRGTAVGYTTNASGVTLAVDLYAGTSSSSLAFVSSTTFNSSSPGKFNTVSTIVPVASGTGFFQVQVRDAAFATEAAALAAGSYGGDSGAAFTTVVGTSFAYNSIVNPNSPAFSTWAPGTFDLSNSSATGAGSVGAINVHVVPEPSTFVLAGLGAAALLVFRRRK